MNNNELTPEFEQALDALLAEVVPDESGRCTTPPDLSAAILARLSQRVSPEQQRSAEVLKASESRKPVVAVATRENRSESTRRWSPWAIAALVVAACAAAVIVLDPFELSPSGPTTPESMASNTTQNSDDLVMGRDPAIELPTQTDRQLVANGNAAIDDEKNTGLDDEANSPTRPRRQPVVIAPQWSPIVQNEGSQESGEQPRSLTAQPVTLVSTKLASTQQSYWEAVGVQPTTPLTAQQWAERLEQSLGIQVSQASFDDLEKLQADLSGPTVSREIAKRLLTQITRGGLASLSSESRELLIDQLSKALQGKSSVDALLVRWMTGSDADVSKESSDDPQVTATDAFYRAMSAGGKSALVEKLAHFTMGVDLRCTRCHDELVGSEGKQDDYWAFAGFIEDGVVRGQTQWTVSSKPASKPKFFALPDGRQRLAKPAVPTAWMSASGETEHSPADLKEWANLKQWSSDLAGSSTLAHGMVDSLWQLVHGRPLRASLVQPGSAPVDDSLTQLHSELAEDLRASGFDVARTLALILQSPMSRLSVPDALQPENALVVSESDHKAALDKVHAFAATQPVQAAMPSKQRVDLAMRRVGGRLDAMQSSRVLAQPASDGSVKSSGDRDDARSTPLVSGFPERVESMPVHWLKSIDDYDSQVEHLAYLSGRDQVPGEFKDTIVALRQQETDRSLTLHRVWWLLQR
ncbi:hypothetical protein [Stieleria varia]|uniref:DUF1549 domain-containing protein n=1 Tax=Stieleria varia TaxID=2528005 RepID=A0A5C6AZV3_9BACT|nr:hypothetical protein [Stieleria varia]TWU04662.1 hypothetical protein Pla52n_27040 [Stieleria varia]